MDRWLICARPTGAKRSRALRTPGGLTQAEIARATGLSPASVSNIVRELAEDGAASVTMVRHNGRRARQVTLNPDAGLVVGVDFGNRHVRVAIADLAHNVLAEDYQTLSYGHRAMEGVPRSEATVRHLVEKVGRRQADSSACRWDFPARSSQARAA